MPVRPNRRLLPVQILTTVLIVAVLIGAAHLVSSGEDSAMFDEAAQQTRLYFEGAARGIKASDQAHEAPRVPVDREEP